MSVKVVNKVIIFFFAITFLIMMGTWNFLHSERFGKLLSQNINEYISKKLKNDIKINKFELKFFPPGIIARNVEFKVDNEDIGQFEFFANEVDANFDLFNTDGAILRLDKLKIYDGYIFYDDTKVIVAKTDKEFDLDFKDLVINEIEVEEVLIEYKDYKLLTKNINIEQILDKINISGTFEPRSHVDPVIDSIKIESIIGKNSISIKKIQLNNINTKLYGKGEINDYLRLNKIKYDMDLRIEGDLTHILNEVGSELQDFRFQNIDFSAGAKIVGESTIWSMQSKISAKNIESKYANLATFNASILINNEELEIKDFIARDQYGKISIENPLKINLKKNIDELNVDAVVENIDCRTAFHYIDDVLFPLKCKLSGDVVLEIRNDIISFTTKEGFLVNDFQVKFKDTLIENKQLTLGENIYLIKDKSFFTKGKYALGNSLLNVEGEIKDEKIFFSGLNNNLDIKDFGRIAGFDFRGKGKVDFIVNGTFDDVKFKFNLNTEETIFEDYYLGKVNGDINLLLKEGIINLNGIEAKVGSTNFNLFGDIGFSNFFIDLKMTFPQTNFYDFKVIHGPLMKDLIFLPDNITGNLKIDYVVKAEDSMENLKVQGDLLGDNITLFDEFLNRLNFKFDFIDNIINFQEVKIYKKDSLLAGSLNLNVDSKKFDLNVFTRNMKLSDFKNYTKLPGELDSKININANIKTLNSKDNIGLIEINLTDSVAREYSFNDSTFKAELKDNLVIIEGQLFGNEISISSKYDLNKKDLEVEGSFLIENLKKFFIAFLGINTKGFDANGRLATNFKSNFNIAKLEKLNLNLELNDILVQKDNLFITNSSKVFVNIKDGVIKPFDFEIIGRNSKISGKGNGDISNEYLLLFNIDYDASLLELLSSRFAEVNGYIKNEINFSRKGKNVVHQLTTSSKNLYLNFTGLPFIFKDTDYRIILSDNKITFDRFIAKLNQGQMKLQGAIDLLLPFPRVNLNYIFERAEINPMAKANALISGIGNILGDKFPYSVVGDFTVDKSLITAEFNDFSSEEVATVTKNDYFPKISTGKKINFLSVNANFHTSSPIYIQNSMVDLSLVGEANVRGDAFEPIVDGRFTMIPGVGKLFFKNNEFIVNKGELVFNENQSYKNPDFDLTALSNINDYNIKMRIFGDVASFDIDLSSEPSLSKNDIFSMIAFGYTEDVSRNLSDSDRGSLSSIGIGSILFSRFNIANTLKESFGLQVNLGTEIQENNNNLLGNREGDVDSGVGRIRSATKIELKKQLMENINLSLSKTVGGSIGSTQKLNLNYKINDKYSLDFIHENRTQDEGDEDIIGESLGADFKIRWKGK